MSFIEKHWYKKRLTWLALLLLPFSYLYFVISALRKFIFKLKSSKQINVPVIIVGNINIGGVGKSPFVSGLVEYLLQKGYQPGIVSRGYGGRAIKYPLIVTDETSVLESGDEPKMLYEQTGCPFVVDPNRSQAVTYLSEKFPNVNVIISDDGLQHYKLHRDIEIVIVDGKRMFGNKKIIPAGPLREPVSRLKQADFLISNGKHIQGFYTMCLLPVAVVSLKDKSEHEISWLKGRKIHAVSGIGNPNRFFDTLVELGASITGHPYSDHYVFSENDFNFEDNLPIVLTHKDAVKCENFSNKDIYYLKISAKIDPEFFDRFLPKLQNCAIAHDVKR